MEKSFNLNAFFVCAAPVLQESNPEQEIKGHNIGGGDGGASTGPVLLLHLPLYRADDSACTPIDLPRCAPWHDLEGSCLKVGSAPPLYVLQGFFVCITQYCSVIRLSILCHSALLTTVSFSTLFA